MKFEMCPRCGGQFLQFEAAFYSGYDCESCQMYYWEEILTGYCHLTIEMAGGLRGIDWVLDTKKCYAIDLEEIEDGVCIKSRTEMPWLPFDITRERFQLLLTFS